MSQEAQCLCITETNRLVLLREVMDVHLGTTLNTQMRSKGKLHEFINTVTVEPAACRNVIS
jgi:hypothetical protein